MARLPRFFVEGQPHHVIQRGNNRVPIFACPGDYLFCLTCLRKAAAEHAVLVHAYVLMTNHLHLLATPPTPQSLPKMMQSVGRRYVQHFNRARKRTGTLMEGRYRGTLIESERYFLTCMRYIELNPVRAGLASRPGEYPWSSYHFNGDGRSDALVTPHAVYLELGRSKATRASAYRGLFEQPLVAGDVEAIRESTNRAWALGGDSFSVLIEACGGRRAQALRRRTSPDNGVRLHPYESDPQLRV
jgi:putative transposase